MALTTVPASLSATALTLTTAAQPNITSVGTLTGLTVSGNIAGTLTTAAQTNITSLGTLTGLTLSGNLTVNANTNITGNLTVDTNSFYVDATNNRVGIGTTSPASPLTINGTDPLITFENGESPHWQLGFENTQSDRFVLYDNNASAYRLVVDSSGNVGIGTTPDSDIKLHIKGDGARVYVDSADYNLISLGRRGSSGASLDQAYLRMKSAGTNTVVIDTAGNSYFNGGNVGIGTSSPDALLEVSNITDNDLPLFISGGTASLSSLPDSTGMAFGYGSAAGYKKGAIIWEFTQTNAIGKLHLCNDGAADANNVQLSDSKMTIDSSGNVGIGTTAPKRMLQVGDNTQAIAALSLQTTTSGLSRIYMGDNDGTAAEYTGMISYVHSDDQLQLFTSQSNRMVIDSSGRVLIGGQTSHASGYSTPGGNSGENAHYSKLEVQGNTYSTAGDGRITLSSGTAWPSSGTQIGAIYFSTAWGGDHAAITANAGGAVGNTDYPGELRFSTTPDGSTTLTERMRIHSNGNVTVGSDTTSHTDETKTMISPNGGGFQVYSMAATNEWWIWNNLVNQSGYTTKVDFRVQNASKGYIGITGSTVIYYSNSDYRLKENYNYDFDATSLVKAMKPLEFTWKEEPMVGKQMGFLAHELKEVTPYVVQGDKDEIRDDGEIRPQVVDQGKLVAVLTKALQEALVRIETLETEVTALKAKVGE